MIYIGELYGKAGGKYFPLGVTEEYVDKLESDLDNTRALLKEAYEYIENAFSLLIDTFDTIPDEHKQKHEVILAKLREAVR
jgi:hypothetical protein